MEKTRDKIHIGNIIKEELKSQRHSAEWLANQIPCDRTNIYKIFKKETLDFNLLLNISNILKKNLLNYYYNYFDNVEK